MPSILLINPWIYDFAAYDFWAKPLGLLYIASLLRKKGFNVYFFDCTDVNNPYTKLPKPKRKKDKRGHYHKVVVEKPDILEDIPLRYKRYGVEVEAFISFLKDLDEKPSAVFITTRMTYWYPGALEVVKYIKEYLPGVKIVVGGIYPFLCKDHAERTLGRENIYPYYSLSQLFGERITFDMFPPPAFDLYTRLDYAAIMVGVGCPFKCAYCATPILFPKRYTKRPEVCFEEILWIVEEKKVKDIAFYDDALLFEKEKLIKPLLKMILENNVDVTFHNPNGVHARFIDDEIAELMSLCFDKVFLSLETVSKHGKRLHEKVSKKEFERAVEILLNRGFSRERIGVYLLVGFPGQSFEEALEDVNFVKSFGLRPSIAEFSPIPGTPLFEEAKSLSKYPLDEPLFHNNTVFPMENEKFTREELNWLKIYARDQ